MIAAGPDFRIPPNLNQLQLLFALLAIYTLNGVGFDVVVTSWFRTPQQNAAAGGVSNSLHQAGLAWDVVVVSTGNALASVVDRVRQTFGAQPALTTAYAMIAMAWRALGPGFEAVAEGDHLHLELDLS